MTDEKSLMVKCACHSEALEVTFWPEVANASENEFWFTLWEMAPSRPKVCWRERIRWCRNILRTGNPWADHIIATPEQAKSVADFIYQNLNGQETKKS